MPDPEEISQNILAVSTGGSSAGIGGIDLC
jgi:hypothetical protein